MLGKKSDPTSVESKNIERASFMILYGTMLKLQSSRHDDKFDVLAQAQYRGAKLRVGMYPDE